MFLQTQSAYRALAHMQRVLDKEQANQHLYGFATVPYCVNCLLDTCFVITSDKNV